MSPDYYISNRYMYMYAHAKQHFLMYTELREYGDFKI